MFCNICDNYVKRCCADYLSAGTAGHLEIKVIAALGARLGHPPEEQKADRDTERERGIGRQGDGALRPLVGEKPLTHTGTVAARLLKFHLT
jgi:hypothetical protein